MAMTVGDTLRWPSSSVPLSSPRRVSFGFALGNPCPLRSITPLRYPVTAEENGIVPEATCSTGVRFTSM